MNSKEFQNLIDLNCYSVFGLSLYLGISEDEIQSWLSNEEAIPLFVENELIQLDKVFQEFEDQCLTILPTYEERVVPHFALIRFIKEEDFFMNVGLAPELRNIFIYWSSLARVKLRLLFNGYLPFYLNWNGDEYCKWRKKNNRKDTLVNLEEWARKSFLFMPDSIRIN